MIEGMLHQKPIPLLPHTLLHLIVSLRFSLGILQHGQYPVEGRWCTGNARTVE